MLKISRILLALLLYASNALATSSLNTNAPVIIVSIKPFYNITAKVMQSVGKPQLLLTKNASPHDYQLKPSDAQLIDGADLVIWGGPELEGYLTKSVSTLANKELDLATIPGLDLLPMRTATNWEQDAHDHAHEHDHDHDHHHAVNDPHFWLDPDNAIIIATAIAQRLGEIDPPHTKIYANNATEFAKQINKDKKIWQQQLAPYKHMPYIVSHDAYQYFDKYFGLDGVGSITLHPEIPPSVQRIQQIQQLLATNHVRCIFSEPQFNYKIIDVLLVGTDVHKGQLDPLGQDQDLGPKGYETLINNLVQGFVQCGKEH
ncbi:MAG TPA: zinc ABC transporter substrate-binding protein [Gammaproteobacteria bacterium]|nr:zinc ABC transporter substrate-binding protein [Gammaproteobacteria bacterium]